MKTKREEVHDLAEITVKGHKIKPSVGDSGTFKAELPDGGEVTSVTLAGLKVALAAELEQAAKEVRLAVDCYVSVGNGNTTLKPAVYVGQRKGSHAGLWENCFMFDIGFSNGPVIREQLSSSEIADRVYVPTIDLEKLKELVEEWKLAQLNLDVFLAAHRFDPRAAVKA